MSHIEDIIDRRGQSQSDVSRTYQMFNKLKKQTQRANTQKCDLISLPGDTKVHSLRKIKSLYRWIAFTKKLRSHAHVRCDISNCRKTPVTEM